MSLDPLRVPVVFNRPQERKPPMTTRQANPSATTVLVCASATLFR